MKLLLFGGTFDPPHNGHIRLLQSAIQAVQPDKVIVMPAGVPPHKAASATPASLRLTMCQCFLPLHPDLTISDWEIGRGGKNYTIDTVCMLEQAYPGAEIYLSVGSDMLTTFTEWRCWQDLLQKAVLVVQSRYDGDESRLQAAAARLAEYGGRVVFAKAPVLEAASSDVRSGRLGPEVLPPLVQRITRQYHLYERAQNMDAKQAEKMVRHCLSKKRYTHTINVRDMAVHLAEKYGADPEKAELAALLHDAVKERSREDLLRILQENAIIAQNAQNSPPPVWHGICAAILAQTEWGVTDPEVLSAIRCHTTGRPGMTKLDKIIYLSDMISAERDYPEVHELRRLAEEDLDTAVRTAVEKNIEWMRQSGKSIDPLSLAALEDLKRQAESGPQNREVTHE